MKAVLVGSVLAIVVLSAAPAFAQTFTIEVTVPTQAAAPVAPSLPSTGFDLILTALLAVALIGCGALLTFVGGKIRRNTA